MKITPLFAAALLLGACTSSSPEPVSPEGEAHAGGETRGHAEGPPEATLLEDGTRLYGAALSEREATPLAQILADPSSFDGQTVLTEGVVSQVCQRSGCWMELRVEAEGPGVMVPMAGHAFFLPQEIVGSRATIEGTVGLEERTADDQEHLESEGASEAGSGLSIEATGVVVH
ncbi:MAG: DUF4920 domain-containing protein [Myxococcales bacterium]|nr:DUF4920 domain-containing protein [Myxococcales bacterium]